MDFTGQFCGQFFLSGNISRVISCEASIPDNFRICQFWNKISDSKILGTFDPKSSLLWQRVKNSPDARWPTSKTKILKNVSKIHSKWLFYDVAAMKVKVAIQVVQSYLLKDSERENVNSRWLVSQLLITSLNELFIPELGDKLDNFIQTFKKTLGCRRSLI